MCINFSNRFAIYLVVSFGVHNYKVQRSWEKFQDEGNKVKAENEALKASLLDKSWLDSVEQKIRSSKAAQNVLEIEIGDKINAVATQSGETSGTVGATTSSSASSVDSSVPKVDMGPAGVQVNASESGRVI